MTDNITVQDLRESISALWSNHLTSNYNWEEKQRAELNAFDALAAKAANHDDHLKLAEEAGRESVQDLILHYRQIVGELDRLSKAYAALVKERDALKSIIEHGYAEPEAHDKMTPEQRAKSDKELDALLEDWPEGYPRDTQAHDKAAQEPDCWAILTPNGSKLVSPEEAKGRRDAYPLYAAPQQASEQRAAMAIVKWLNDKADAYALEYGHDDMGGLSFGQGAHADAKRDYHSTLIELAEEIREKFAAHLKVASEQSAPVGLTDEQIIEIGMRHFKPGHNPDAIPAFVKAVREILVARPVTKAASDS